MDVFIFWEEKAPRSSKQTSLIFHSPGKNWILSLAPGRMCVLCELWAVLHLSSPVLFRFGGWMGLFSSVGRPAVLLACPPPFRAKKATIWKKCCVKDVSCPRESDWLSVCTPGAACWSAEVASGPGAAPTAPTFPWPSPRSCCNSTRPSALSPTSLLYSRPGE